MCAPRSHVKGVGEQLHSFLNLALAGVDGQLHTSGILSMGGYVEYKAGLEETYAVKCKIFHNRFELMIPLFVLHSDHTAVLTGDRNKVILAMLHE